MPVLQEQNRPCAPMERGLLTILSGPRSSWLLASLALRASLRLFNFVPTKLSMPLPARLESSKRCYWLLKTSGWNEWAETTSAATPAWFIERALRAKPKTKNQKPKENIRPQAAKIDSGCCGFTRPIRASPQVKKAGSHARMTRARIVAQDVPYDPLA